MLFPDRLQVTVLILVLVLLVTWASDRRSTVVCCAPAMDDDIAAVPPTLAMTPNFVPTVSFDRVPPEGCSNTGGGCCGGETAPTPVPPGLSLRGDVAAEVAREAEEAKKEGAGDGEESLFV